MDIPAGAEPQSPRQVHFEAASHQRETFKLLKQFYQNDDFCDLVVQCGSLSIKCHRLILACVSKYFRSMFQLDMVESRQETVTIKDIDEHAMKAIIDFAYTSKITLDIDHVQTLLYASSILQVETVARACCDFMKQQLDPLNCIGVRTFAEQHGRMELVKRTDDYIMAHFEEVCNNDDFVAITPNTMVALVASPSLSVESELVAYEAVMKWIRHDVDARKQYLPQLLKHIRFPHMAADFIVEVGTSPTFTIKSISMVRTYVLYIVRSSKENGIFAVCFVSILFRV